MGRANRREMNAMVETRPSGGDVAWALEIGRRPAPSLIYGGDLRSPFASQYEALVTKNPSLLPQGPPPLEDGEPNPEATTVEDMSVGQIGEDLQGNRFQIIAGDGRPPQEVLLRSLENEEVFWVDHQRTLLLDTVSFGELGDTDLQEWMERQDLQGSSEDAVWEMRHQGLWDWSICDRRSRIFLIGNWVLYEHPPDPGQSGSRRGATIRCTDVQQARSHFEERAENIEAYPQIEAFQEALLHKSVPKPKEYTDQLRHSVWEALLGNREISLAAQELQIAARLQNSKELQDKLLSLSIDLLELDPRPSIKDNDFVVRVGPLWRRAAAIQLEQ